MGTWSDDYREWLELLRSAGREREKSSMQEILQEQFLNSSSYHSTSTKNGELFPVVATRKDSRQASLMLLPGTDAAIGDLFEIFDLMWLCVELYEDEYGMLRGKLWLCNHLFKFIDGASHVAEVYGVIDDGSYSNPTGTALPAEKYTLKCYLPLNTSTASLYVDKRLALGTRTDQNNNTILEVGKIAWMDPHTHNYGKNSHLVVMGLESDVYNKETDDLTNVICDNVATATVASSANAMSITGNAGIRIGTKRTYKAIVGTQPKTTNISWSVVGSLPTGVSFAANAGVVTLDVPLNSSLIGSTITIKCVDTTGTYADASMQIEVISIG